MSSDLSWIAFFVLWSVSSLTTLLWREKQLGRTSGSEQERVRHRQRRNLLYEVFRSTLFFWMLFIPAIAFVVFGFVLLVLSPTVSNGFLPASAVAMALQLASLR
jgi:hypothetical protein